MITKKKKQFEENIDSQKLGKLSMGDIIPLKRRIMETKCDAIHALDNETS